MEERKKLAEVELSVGKAIIYEGTGDDFLTAIETAEATSNGTPSFKDIVVSLMELLVEINGKRVSEVEIKKLPMRDFMKLYGNFLKALE